MTFTASNGIRLNVSADNQAEVVYPISGDSRGLVTWVRPNEMVALREYLQHERDEELGRWRWPENPNYVVYPNPDEAFERMFSPGLDLVILREPDGMTKGYARDEDKGGEPMPHRASHVLAARAYFEAHPEPEPKPWHDAKPGEVWAISTENVDDEVAVRVAMLNERLTFEYVTSISTRIHADDKRIVTGRRIWPEDES